MGVQLDPRLLVDVISISPTELNEANGECWKRKLADGRWKVRCVGQHCGITNRNNRRYPGDTTWGKHTQAESSFVKRVGARRVIGQVEHPTDGRSNLGAAAILVTKVEPPCSDGRVFVEWETLATPGGETVGGLLESDVGFGMSSRGNGTVLRADDGVDEVQADYEPVTFDCVADESTPGAEVAAKTIRESLERLVEAAGGNVEEAIRRDREAASSALASLTESAAPAPHGEVLLSSGELTYRAYDTGLGRYDLWREDARGEELVQRGFPSIEEARGAARRKVSEYVNLGGDTPIPQSDNVPAGSEWLLGTEDGAGHYVACECAPADWRVWYCGHNTEPVEVAKGLRTRSAARDAAEAHLHGVVGEAYQVADALPFEGTCITLRYDTPDEMKKATKALESAGFRCAQKADTTSEITTKYADAEAALSHVHQVLRGAGVEMSVTEGGLPSAAGVPSTSYMEEPGMGDPDYMDGGEMEVGTELGAEYMCGGGARHMDEPEDDADYMDYMGDEEDEDDADYMGYEEEEEHMDDPYLESEMVGDPDTMPDDLEAADDIGDEYEGGDPEDLDLDLDVNEAKAPTGLAKEERGNLKQVVRTVRGWLGTAQTYIEQGAEGLDTTDINWGRQAQRGQVKLRELARQLRGAARGLGTGLGRIGFKGQTTYSGLSPYGSTPHDMWGNVSDNTEDLVRAAGDIVNDAASAMRQVAFAIERDGRDAREAGDDATYETRKQEAELVFSKVGELQRLSDNIPSDWTRIYGESRRSESVDLGPQRKNTTLKATGKAQGTPDEQAPQRKNTDVKKGTDTTGEQGTDRPPKEGGSELPQKGKGKAEPQKAAKMAETVIKRALPDLRRAWRRGDGEKAARIARFIESACIQSVRFLRRPSGGARRVRYLQGEVARLESENARLRELTEAMAEVQRTEVLEYERRLVLDKHPELAPMRERFARCDTVGELHEEARALLELTRGAPTPEAPPEAPVVESSEPETGFTMQREPSSSSRGGGASVASTDIEGVPSTQPITEAAAPVGSSASPVAAGDSASRLAAYRRRRRQR